jgi:hypothetical protein
MTENELIKKTIPIILGMNDENSNVIAIPEVPRSWGSHNDCMDLLLMSLRTKQMMAIEFKLNSVRKLENQMIDNYGKTGINTIGIIPKNAKQQKIFSIDSDAQIERLCARLLDFRGSGLYWSHPHPGNNGLIYWYAYKGIENINYDNAGLGWGGKKEEFADVYKRAMKAMIEEVGMKNPSPLVISHCLRGYSESSVKKFLREVVK